MIVNINSNYKYKLLRSEKSRAISTNYKYHINKVYTFTM